VIDYFNNAWATTEVLFASLQGSEAFYRQPYHQLRHPMVFYYVHPAVLYINKFRVAGLLDAGLDKYIEQVCSRLWQLLLLGCAAAGVCHSGLSKGSRRAVLSAAQREDARLQQHQTKKAAA